MAIKVFGQYDEVLPGKGSEWYNAILAVKTTHPKPE